MTQTEILFGWKNHSLIPNGHGDTMCPSMEAVPVEKIMNQGEDGDHSDEHRSLGLSRSTLLKEKEINCKHEALSSTKSVLCV